MVWLGFISRLFRVWPWRGIARHGEAWPGEARFLFHFHYGACLRSGGVWSGQVRHARGLAWHGFISLPLRVVVEAGRGWLRSGSVGNGRARRGFFIGELFHGRKEQKLPIMSGGQTITTNEWPGRIGKTKDKNV